MTESRAHVWVIPLSFLVALMLTLIPMPDWAAPFRPEWLGMTVIYWCLALPRRVGTGYAFVLGLLLDVAKGALMGQHALGLTVVAYLTLRLHQRIRVFPLWQQALSVGAMLAIHLLIVLWVYGATGQAPNSALYWAPLSTSVLLWPWVFILLRDIRRRSGLTG